jgi:general stress protein 26
MPSLKERILEVVKAPILSGFATMTTHGKPWVRYVVAEASSDLAFRFSSFRKARKVAQIDHNPAVHLTCGITGPTHMGPYLQIQGRAVFTTDREARHAFWIERLRAPFPSPDDPNFGVVVVQAYRIELCHLGEEAEVCESNGQGLGHAEGR